MQNTEQNYEEHVSFMTLLALALRRWQWLLASVLIGAVLLGVYEYLKPVAPTQAEEEQITELEASRNADKKTLTNNETELNEIEIDTRTNEAKIAADEALLASYEASQETLRNDLITLQSGLEQSQSVLTDPDSTPEARVAVIVELPMMTNNVISINTELNSLSEKIRTYTNQITSLQAEISGWEDRAETLNESNEKLRASIKDAEKKIATLKEGEPKEKTVVTSAITGGIAGLVVYFGIVFLQYILDKRLRTAAVLKEQYHVPVLGEFYSEKAKGHKRNHDKILDILVGDVQTLPEEQSVYDLVAAGVAADVKTPTRLAVTGTVPMAMLQDVAEKLGPALPDHIQAEAHENPVYNAAFLTQLKDYSVLLVEAKGVSDKQEISKLMEVLRRNKVTILGAVVK